MKMLEEITLWSDEAHHSRVSLKPDEAGELFYSKEKFLFPLLYFLRLDFSSHCNDLPQCPTHVFLKGRAG